MTPEALPPDVWAAEGRRAAPALEEVAAAIVTGRDPDAAAAVALGLARGQAAGRRVAVADLVGGLAALTPLVDQPGLLECLRDGHPVSEVGQPVPGTPNVYVLPSGMGPIAERWVMESGRWEKLIAGFREVDALLLLVTPAAAPGLDVLVSRADGVVAVDLPPADLRQWPLLATIDHPEPELPPITPRAPVTPGVPGVPGARVGARRSRRGVGRALIATLVLAGGYSWWHGRSGAEPAGTAPPAPPAQPAQAASAETLPAAAPRLLEVTMGPLVNPSDSLRALRFSAELVAANTLAGANSTLRFPSGEVPAATVAPVLLGASAQPWYRALVGAWSDRGDAEAWLEAHRATGEVREGVGRVLEAPFALLIAEAVAPAEAPAVIERCAGRGVLCYALQQQSGRVHVYAGAFESVSQATWLASTWQDATGEIPRVAYRTGRMF